MYDIETYDATISIGKYQFRSGDLHVCASYKEPYYRPLWIMKQQGTKRMSDVGYEVLHEGDVEPAKVTYICSS